MKNNKFLMVVYSLTFIFVLVGSTFAYFTQTANSGEGALGVKSGSVGISLEITPLYTDNKLIPLNDEEVPAENKHDDVMTAYENECVDVRGFGACEAYTITVTNLGPELVYNGTIKFSTNEIEHLKYLLLDDEDNIVVNKTVVVPNTEQTLSSINPLAANEVKTYRLLIWVPNYNYNQDEYDGGGSFNAIVTYRSAGNTEITGSISGN